MPSPIGHALAGAAIAYALRQPRWRAVGACALFAALPDIDLLYMPTHRTATHSIPVAILGTIVAMAVTGWVNAGSRRLALACALAWSSHIVLDWLGADANPPYGIQAWWPFSETWFFSGWNIFPGTERRQPFSARALLINLRAALQELAIMGAVVVAVRLWKRRT